MSDTKTSSMQEALCCPGCGSFEVEWLYPMPAEATVKCVACPWQGRYVDLITYPSYMAVDRV